MNRCPLCGSERDDLTASEQAFARLLQVELERNRDIMPGSVEINVGCPRCPPDPPEIIHDGVTWTLGPPRGEGIEVREIRVVDLSEEPGR